MRLYALPLLLATILIVYCHAFLARRMTRMLLLAGVIAAVAHPLLSQLFIQRLEFGIRGIPIALSGTLFLLVIVMVVLYRIYLREARFRKLLPFVIRLAISALAACVVLKMCIRDRLKLRINRQTAKVLEAKERMSSSWTRFVLSLRRNTLQYHFSSANYKSVIRVRRA